MPSLSEIRRRSDVGNYPGKPGLRINFANGGNAIDRGARELPEEADVLSERGRRNKNRERGVHWMSFVS